MLNPQEVSSVGKGLAEDDQKFHSPNGCSLWNFSVLLNRRVHLLWCQQTRLDMNAYSLTWRTVWTQVGVYAPVVSLKGWTTYLTFFPPKVTEISSTGKKIECCFILFLFLSPFLPVWNEGAPECCSIQDLSGTSNICKSIMTALSRAHLPFSFNEYVKQKCLATALKSTRSGPNSLPPYGCVTLSTIHRKHFPPTILLFVK